MSSFDKFRAYLQARAAFTEEEFAFMATLFIPRALSAGEFLQRAGDVATHAAFVAQGCLRSYVIDGKGKEHIVQFAPEDWWLGRQQQPDVWHAVAVLRRRGRGLELLLIDPPSHQQIIDRVPGYAASFRTGLQRHAAAKDQRIVNSLSTSAEERYQEFLKMYPSIALRVPQWMLASYLGVSPETLSRIRKSLSRK